MRETIALSKREAAEILGISVRTIERLIALKHLEVHPSGPQSADSTGSSRRLVAPRSSDASCLIQGTARWRRGPDNDRW